MEGRVTCGRMRVMYGGEGDVWKDEGDVWKGE